MKKDSLNSVVCLLITMVISAQSPFHIIGNLRVHDQGQLGFHTDLINDGDFDKNLGEVGFYHDTRTLAISGERMPVFYDMITKVRQDLHLNVSVGVTHFKEFIRGRILTPRNNPNVFLDLQNDSPFIGESDDNHVDGYLRNSGILDFSFPVGDDFRLRSMRIDPLSSQNYVIGAYFFEDPNQPSTFTTIFNTSQFEPSLSVVSPFEFWCLRGSISTKVTLTWDSFSNISFLTDDLDSLRVVGWSTTDQKWINLGNTNALGNTTNGEITSDLILPDDYHILTIGSVLKAGKEVFVYTGFSPNGDGINDTLIIQGIESNPNNELLIYNRWGVLVYNKKGYDNSWKGASEGRLSLNKNKKLPVGTYYYVLNLEGKKMQSGFIYLQQ